MRLGLVFALSSPSILSAGPATPAGEPITTASILQLVAGLLVVVLAIVGSAWLMRRFARLPAAMRDRMKIVGSMNVGPRERLVVVQVGEVQMLLGVAPGRVQMLHVLEPPIVPAPQAQEAGETFAKRLAALLRQGSSS